MIQRSVLFFCHYHEPLRTTVLPLAEALAERSGLASRVIFDRDEDGRMAKLCAEAGVECHPDPPPGSTAPTRGGGLLARAFRRALPPPLRSARDAIRGERREIERLATLLGELRPAVLVLLDDRTVLACRWICAARRARVPTVAVQSAAFAWPDSLAAIRLAASPTAPVGRAERALRACVARLVKGAVWRRGDELAWFTPPATTLGLWALGAYPTNPWIFGGGHSNVVAVAGEAWRDRILLHGVPAAKLEVTGHPDHDRWYDAVTTWCPADAEAVAAELGIAPERRIVTVIGPALQLRAPGGSRGGEIPFERLKDDLRSVLELAHEVDPEAAIVFKCHPRDRDADFGFLGSAADWLHVVHEIDLEQLVAASGAMLCQWSSTAMVGLAMGTPVLIFDLYESASSEVWKGVAGPVRAASLAELRHHLRAVLDRGTEAPQPGRDAFVREFLRLDGQATARIVEVICSQIRDAIVMPCAAPELEQ